MPMYVANPTTIGINENNASLQSTMKKYTMTMIGASRLEVNSGTTCARVVSMLSILSTMMFLNEPDGVSFTYPSGTLASLSQHDFLIFASTVNVALCEHAVDTLWQSSASINDPAMIRAFTIYSLRSLSPSRNILTTSAMMKYGTILNTTLITAKMTLHT